MAANAFCIAGSIWAKNSSEKRMRLTSSHKPSDGLTHKSWR